LPESSYGFSLVRISKSQSYFIKFKPLKFSTISIIPTHFSSIFLNEISAELNNKNKIDETMDIPYF